jgi:uncharacterized protein (TIGR02246 family)
MLKTAAIAAAGLIVLAACQPTTQDTTADEAAIKEINVAWGAKYNAGDADGVAALYAEDAVLLPPGAPSVAGRTGIREFITGDSANTKAAGLTMNIAEASTVGVSGDLGWQNGTFTVTDASGATVDAGKFLSVFRKQDGKWLLIRDTWNSDRAPAPAPAPGTEPAPAEEAASEPAAN